MNRINADMAAGKVTSRQAVAIIIEQITVIYQKALRDYLSSLQKREGLKSQRLALAKAEFQKPLARYEDRVIFLDLQINMQEFNAFASSSVVHEKETALKTVLARISQTHDYVAHHVSLPNRIFANEVKTYEEAASLLAYDDRQQKLFQSYDTLQKMMNSRRPNFDHSRNYLSQSVAPLNSSLPFLPQQREPASARFTVRNVLSKLASDQRKGFDLMDAALKHRNMREWVQAAQYWKVLSASPESTFLRANAVKIRRQST